MDDSGKWAAMKLGRQLYESSFAGDRPLPSFWSVHFYLTPILYSI